MISEKKVAPQTIKYERRHSRWYEQIIYGAPFQLFTGLLLVVLFNAWLLWDAVDIELHDNAKRHSVIAVAVTFAFVLIALRKFKRFPGCQSIIQIFSSVTIGFATLLAVMFFLRLDYSRPFILNGYVFSLIWFFCAYALGRKYRRQKFALVPDPSVTQLKENADSDGVEWRILDVPDLGCTRYDGVVANLHSSNLGPEWTQFLTHCSLNRIPVFNLEQICESLTGKVSLNGLSENELGTLEPPAAYEIAKRLLDILGVMITLPLVSPLMLVTAILIKLESPGPIFFIQNRVGYGNRDFKIYKFRSMCKDSEKNGAQFASTNDMRVTRVGKFIRKMRIDELPQLLNVLKGDMSIIGPRPEQRSFVDKFEQEIPFYSYRHVVRPGITGWAQVVHGYAADTEDTRQKLQYDLYYIKHFSIWIDMIIVFKTIKTILTGFGAR